MAEVIHPVIIEWLYAREAMRRLGFGPSDLFFMVQTNGELIERGQHVKLDGAAIALKLKAQGREFTWTIGACKLEREEIEAQYRRACDLWNSGAPMFSRDGFVQSRPCLMGAELIMELRAKGFVLAQGA